MKLLHVPVFQFHMLKAVFGTLRYQFIKGIGVGLGYLVVAVGAYEYFAWRNRTVGSPFKLQPS